MKTRKVVIVTDLYTTFGKELVAGVMDFKRRIPDEKWLIPLLLDKLDEKSLKADHFDGIITPVYNEKQAKILKSCQTKVVNITESHFSQQLPTVTWDNESIGRMAAQHLISCNAVKFIFFGSSNFTYANRRFEGFHDELLKHGKNCERIDYRPQKIDYIFGLQEYDVNSVANVLKNRGRRLGIFAENDRYAVMIVKAAIRLGLTFPDDLVLVGVNDDPMFCDLHETTISSIKHSGFEVGFKAAERLHRLMNEKETGTDNELIKPHEISIRESSDIISLEDDMVARAMQYIRKHINDCIDVSDVSSVVPISRRTLERRFRECLGKSIHQMILNERLELAKALLINTKRSVERIALEAGFPSLRRMIASFHQEINMTPDQYRKNRASASDSFFLNKNIGRSS